LVKRYSKKYNVEILGTSIEAIINTEDRKNSIMC